MTPDWRWLVEWATAASERHGVSLEPLLPIFLLAIFEKIRNTSLGPETHPLAVAYFFLLRRVASSVMRSL